MFYFLCKIKLKAFGLRCFPANGGVLCSLSCPWTPGSRDPHPSALQAAAGMSVAHHCTQFSISIPKVEPNWVLGFHFVGPMDQLKLIEIVPPVIEKQLLGTGSNSSQSLSCSVHPPNCQPWQWEHIPCPGVPLCPSISLTHPCLNPGVKVNLRSFLNYVVTSSCRHWSEPTLKCPATPVNEHRQITLTFISLICKSYLTNQTDITGFGGSRGNNFTLLA